MQVLEILSGLPASGKSTYAARAVGNGTWHCVNWDSYRWFNPDGSQRDYKFTSSNEREIKIAALADADQAYRKGFNVMVDNTNLVESTKNYWRDFARERHMHVTEIDFDTPLDECIRRNDLRTGWQKVPRAVIERMALWSGRVTWDFKQIVVVDMDGTLADLSHRQRYITPPCPACYRGWRPAPETRFSAVLDMSECPVCKNTGIYGKKDWDSFFKTVSEDKPIKGVIEWVRSLYDHGYCVCVVSGRPIDATGIATEEWLKKNDAPFHHLFMRAAGDKRDDVIVKKEILDKMPKHQIEFSIDDRPRVIRMWRENGVKCYDVGNGVEF